MNLSIIIPAYNESSKLTRDLEAAVLYGAKKQGRTEVLVVDDGSRDDTARVARDFAEQNSNATVSIKVLSYGGNRGKGYAVRYGVAQSLGEAVAFVDSGLCVPLEYLEVGLGKLAEGFDFAIASRRMKGSRIQRNQPAYRQWGSIVFWRLMKLVMGIEVTDTQCGFKIYRGECARRLFGTLRTDGFMFDIEALRAAKRLKYRGAEFPVEWSNDGDTRYHPVFGTWKNLTELLWILLRDLNPPRRA